MLYYIEKILSIRNYTVTCLFNTGEARIIDLTDVIEKYSKINDGLISSLSNEAYFKTVGLDSYGTLQWDNGVDFDPDILYQTSKKQIATI